jgi:hypothetical protein
MTFTDIRNNYWDVLDTNHGTHVFSSASGSYVVLADATYVAWVALGNTATVIDTEANLYILFNRAAVANLPSYFGVNITQFSVPGTVVLTNPMLLVQEVETAAGPGTYILQLAQMNLPTSLPLGVDFRIRVTASNDLVVKNSAGTTLKTIRPDEEWAFRPLANSTAIGSFDIRLCSPAAMTDGQLWVGQTGAAPLPKTISGDVAFAASGAATVTVKSARVYNSADIACADNVVVTLTFDSERYDTDTIHSTVSNTSRLTATTAGKYDIKGSISYTAAASGVRLARILLNGATVIANETRASASAADATAMTVATVYDLAAGDYVELQAYQNSGGSLNALHTANYSPEFMMTRLGA